MSVHTETQTLIWYEIQPFRYLVSTFEPLCVNTDRDPPFGVEQYFFLTNSEVHGFYSRHCSSTGDDLYIHEVPK